MTFHNFVQEAKVLYYRKSKPNCFHVFVNFYIIFHLIAICEFKEALYDVIHIVDPFETTFWSGIPWTNLLCNANWNSSGKLCKSLKHLMKWYIYIFFTHVNNIDYQLFLQRTSERRTENVWNENVSIYNWRLIKKMSPTAYDSTYNLLSMLCFIMKCSLNILLHMWVYAINTW